MAGERSSRVEPALRILFVGNSHTYANALPYLVREMIRARHGPDACDVWSLTTGGRNLAWHAAEPGTVQAISLTGAGSSFPGLSDLLLSSEGAFHSALTAAVCRNAALGKSGTERSMLERCVRGSS